MARAKTVDDYIVASKHWQGELRRLREILCGTELVEEIKWGAPCYTYNGKNVVGLGAFKSYVGLWFHQGALLQDDKKVLINAQEGKTRALRQWRMNSAQEIRPAVIRRYVNEAIRLLKEGKRIEASRNKALVVPPELKNALQNNMTVEKNFNSLTPGRQCEYAEYISEAKRADTKQNRIKKIVPMIKAGIGLRDKYGR